MTDSNEVIQNIDPFDTLAQEPFPTWFVAFIVIVPVVGVILIVYFIKFKKTTEKVE